MNLEGRKIVLNRPVSEIVELLKNPLNYEQLMPEGLQKFEAISDGFKFALKGMPEIALKLGEINENKAVFEISKFQLEFELSTVLNKISENQTEAQMFFEGKFNPFIKMMVEKPLQNFMNALTDKIESLYK